MIIIRKPESIYQAEGAIQNGTFYGRWHFSFDQYYDPEYIQFGALRVFNDDTLSPGAIWPLHPHQEIEVVTYCAEGEFCHADERGKGGVLKKGWVQHTTTGRGMWHSEINNRKDIPMRFVQMWFFPASRGLEPSVEQKVVDKKSRSNRLLPLVSNTQPGALPISSDVLVYSCFLQSGQTVNHLFKDNRGVYLYVIEGGPVEVNAHQVLMFGAAKIVEEKEIGITAKADAELLLVDILLS